VYGIDHLPGFEHLVFTESSTEYLSLPQSVAFATARDSVLQSAREAWAFRIDSNGALESGRYQSTRTAALGVKVGDQYCIALCDSNKLDENILLAQPTVGYDLHVARKPWLVAKQDPVMKVMLARAQDERRVVPALAGTLELSTSHSGGTSPYGTHPFTQTILGSDLTETVASYLRDHGHGNGYVWTLSPTTMRELGVDDNHVEVRRVGVGGSDGFISNYLGANVRCGNDGRARGVRERSTGNRG